MFGGWNHRQPCTANHGYTRNTESSECKNQQFIWTPKAQRSCLLQDVIWLRWRHGERSGRCARGCGSRTLRSVVHDVRCYEKFPGAMCFRHSAVHCPRSVYTLNLLDVPSHITQSDDHFSVPWPSGLWPHDLLLSLFGTLSLSPQLKLLVATAMYDGIWTAVFTDVFGKNYKHFAISAFISCSSLGYILSHSITGTSKIFKAFELSVKSTKTQLILLNEQQFDNSTCQCPHWTFSHNRMVASRNKRPKHALHRSWSFPNHRRWSLSSNRSDQKVSRNTSRGTERTHWWQLRRRRWHGARHTAPTSAVPQSTSFNQGGRLQRQSKLQCVPAQTVLSTVGCVMIPLSIWSVTETNVGDRQICSRSSAPTPSAQKFPQVEQSMQDSEHQSWWNCVSLNAVSSYHSSLWFVMDWQSCWGQFTSRWFGWKYWKGSPRKVDNSCNRCVNSWFAGPDFTVDNCQAMPNAAEMGALNQR